MKRQLILHYVTFLVLVLVKKALSNSPHIIFMLIDDLGWNDVSFHGSTQIPTPIIDMLAYNGVILNNYYVQPICTPSRGSLMTGKYPIKLGLQHYVIVADEPWGLSPEEIILPQHLKQLGYATHGVGKWHLGHFQRDYLPTNRGFDSYLGYYTGKEDYFIHAQQNNENFGLDFHDMEENAWNYTGYYGTEAFTDRAKKIIKSHDSSKPLFLYISHQAMHAGNSYSPLQAPMDYIKKFSHIKDEKRRVFAAMASVLDKSVAEIFLALDARDMLENSVLVFSTDNGGAVEGIDESTGSNWPLRGSKYNMWEGGIKGTAFIWSPLLANAKRSVSKNLMHISDWLPTLYAVAGGNPKDLGTIDGFNIWPSLTQNSTSPRDHILYNIDPVWKVEGIRKGQYKLLTGSVFDGKFDGWFDKEGKMQENTPVEENELTTQHEVYKTLLKNSEVYEILTKKYRNNPIRNLRHSSDIQATDYCDSTNYEVKDAETNLKYSSQEPYPVEVDCGIKPKNASTNCHPMKEYCLFDIENDPCEFNNLANTLPLVVQELKELLEKYRLQSVPIRNKPSDPKANPKYHGYAWVPWVDSRL